MPRVRRTPVVVLVNVKKPKTIEKYRFSTKIRCPEQNPSKVPLGTVRRGKNGHWFCTLINDRGFQYWQDWCLGRSKPKLVRKSHRRAHESVKKDNEKFRKKQIKDSLEWKDKEKIQSDVYELLRSGNLITGGEVIVEGVAGDNVDDINDGNNSEVVVNGFENEPDNEVLESE